ncbi:hypothetical protein P4U90_01925 [Cytobacillus kochii]|uniref:lipopolysaccharide biosynthesis protein n=1 Tax=Cytobacillus kochii TaxID=859143 RepID=UPI002E1CCEA8|nr:hypothetical protein [Cytobacillus kochii]
MRSRYSLINITAGLTNQLIITMLSFLSRTIFIQTLGVEYLGINGLFTNLLAMLTLAEAGLGASIMYSLYKPVADNDYMKIRILMKFYRQAYMVIAAIVFVLGLLLFPFLDFFVKGANIEDVELIYFIFLLNTVAPYFYIHKNSFLNVAQRGYIVTAVYTVSSIVTAVMKIAILSYTQNYLLYLIIDSVITIANSIILAVMVNRMYPYLREKVEGKLDEITKGQITTNVKAIVIQNIGNYLLFGTEHLLISSFVSLVAVGIYSNYKMVIDIARTFINQVFSNVYHSVGNLVANESMVKIIAIYKCYRLVNFWLYSSLTIVLAFTLEPFIRIWLGSDFLFYQEALLVILLLTFYERGMRNSISAIKTTAGLFREDQYAPLLQAGISLIFALVLVQFLGITGIFLGHFLSALFVPFWYTPYVVYKKLFKLPVRQYFTSYLSLMLIGLVAYLLTKIILMQFSPVSFSTFLIYLFVSLVLPNLLYIIVFYRTDEFQYILKMVLTILRRLQAKRRDRMLSS